MKDCETHRRLWRLARCARRRRSASVQAIGFHSAAGMIRQATTTTTCAHSFSRRRHSTRQSRCSARRSPRSMSRPIGRLRTWWFGYAMCTRPVNRFVSRLACSTSRTATGTNILHQWRSESATACASSSMMRLGIPGRPQGEARDIDGLLADDLAASGEGNAVDFRWHSRSATAPAAGHGRAALAIP